MASKLRKDEHGAVFVEFTAVFPILMAIVLGTVDLSFLMIDWASFTRAPYVGARFAAISDPVAAGINGAIAAAGSGAPGQSCMIATTGAASGKCTISSSSCATTGSTTTIACTNSFTASATALNAIVSVMNKGLIGREIDRRQVIVTYTPTNVGYVMRPGGSPMNITLSVRCVRHQFYFLAPLMRWIFSAPESQCSGIGSSDGVALPTFSTTLPSEDLTTN